MSILRIRRSQLVSKHGVGSVFPGTDGISRLTAGLDRWFSHEYEENLEVCTLEILVHVKENMIAKNAMVH